MFIVYFNQKKAFEFPFFYKLGFWILGNRDIIEKKK